MTDERESDRGRSLAGQPTASSKGKRIGLKWPVSQCKAMYAQIACKSVCPHVSGSAQEWADTLAEQCSTAELTCRAVRPASSSAVLRHRRSTLHIEPSCLTSLYDAGQGRTALNCGATEQPAILLQYISWFCAMLTLTAQEFA